MPKAGDSPFLNMEINPDGAGSATGELVIDAVHRNPYGIVHGGVYAALADNAMGGAITGLMGSGKTFTTVDLHIRYLRPIKSGVISMQGDDGKLVATATASFFVVED
jgi:uncharacterized protein (TIGR00369 family)